MKKLLYICGIGIFVISVLGECLLFGGKKEGSATLNGVMLVGEHQALKTIKDKFKNEIKSATLYKIKQTESEGKHVFVMDEKTAQKVVKTGIIAESDSNDDKFGSEPIFSLPKITDNEALLLAHPKNKNIKNVELSGMKIKTKYKNNAWLGGGDFRNKKLDELLLIVDNDTFEKLPTSESYLNIVELNKTYKFNKYERNNAEKQSNNEYFKFIKNIQTNIKDGIAQGVLIKKK
ncbi:TPA: hypothetical protein ROY17_005361 [Bacillus thuringiensis]|nr:hypothetical protein [Bacillus thuringiensis]